MVREPGLDLDTLFARIRLRTNEATNGVQTPWEVSQLQQVVMLVPGTPNAPPAGAPQGLLSAPQAAMGAPPARRAPRPIRDLPPEDAYAVAIEQDDLPTYVEYVRLYPNSPYAQRVWATIRARREALLWRRALLANSPEAYWTYIQRYPDGMYVFDARRRLRRLSAADGPPPGFRMLDFDDVPLPVAGEPARLYDVYPAAPPPRRFLAPPPAFIVGLPPPPRPGGGLWRRQQPAFPMIVNPGPRPGTNSGPGFWRTSRPGSRQGFPGQKGPVIVNQPPPGGPPPGFQGPPKAWQKPGTGIGAVPPGPPPGFKGQQQFQKGHSSSSRRARRSSISRRPDRRRSPDSRGRRRRGRSPAPASVRHRPAQPQRIQQQQIQQQQIQQQQIQQQQIQQQQIQQPRPPVVAAPPPPRAPQGPQPGFQGPPPNWQKQSAPPRRWCGRRRHRRRNRNRDSAGRRRACRRVRRCPSVRWCRTGRRACREGVLASC